MLILELLTGQPTPEPTQPLGDQAPAPVLASLPQPAPARTATPGDAPGPPPKPGQEQQMIANGMPTGYMSASPDEQQSTPPTA